MMEDEIVEYEDTGMLEKRRVEEIVMGTVADLVQENVRIQRRSEPAHLLARRKCLDCEPERKLPAKKRAVVGDSRRRWR